MPDNSFVRSNEMHGPLERNLGEAIDGYSVSAQCLDGCGFHAKRWLG